MPRVRRCEGVQLTFAKSDKTTVPLSFRKSFGHLDRELRRKGEKITRSKVGSGHEGCGDIKEKGDVFSK